MNIFFTFVTLAIALAFAAGAQQRLQPVDARVASNSNSTDKLPDPISVTASAGPDYVLGPGDQVSLTVGEIDDQFTDKVFRIETSGEVKIPLAGRIHAAGLTTQGLEREIEKRLGKIIQQPEVSANVVAFASQPISVLGEVKSPGVHQVQGQKTLIQALSLAGGFTEEVGNTVTISRKLQWGEIPLPDARNDSTGQFSIGSLSVKEILHGSNPAKNIAIMPDDVITVRKAEVVYAVGSVNKPGGFILGQNEGLSTLQVISLAEGLNRTAAPEKAMILRLVSASKQRTEVAVDLKKLMHGAGTDIPLQPGDILFVPNSRKKEISNRTLDAIAQTAGSAAIYGRF